MKWNDYRNLLIAKQARFEFELKARSEGKRREVLTGWEGKEKGNGRRFGLGGVWHGVGVWGSLFR